MEECNTKIIYQVVVERFVNWLHARNVILSSVPSCGIAGGGGPAGSVSRSMPPCPFSSDFLPLPHHHRNGGQSPEAHSLNPCASSPFYPLIPLYPHCQYCHKTKHSPTGETIRVYQHQDKAWAGKVMHFWDQHLLKEAGILIHFPDMPQASLDQE